MAINILVIFLTLLSATKADDNEVITSLIQAYSVTGAESKSYFSSHGKAMFQQVSMLDSMALAKLGKDVEATDQLASLAMQTILADLPVEYQAAGGLMKLMQSDRSFFRNTIITAQRNLDTVSKGIKQKLAEFKNSNTKTDKDKQRVQEAIKASVASQENGRRNIFNAWKADLRQLQQLAETSKPSPKAVRAWHVYGKAKFFIKRIQFPPRYRVGPWSDILGIVVSGIGLHNAIKNKNSIGMVNSVLGIVGSVVGLTLFTSALVTGLEILSTLNALAGAAFFMLPLIVKLFWPSNLAIDTANKLTEISRNDLDGHLHQLGQFSESGARSFGWMYQVNSGVLIERMIQPNTPIKFWQPSCATPGTTPCDPKTANYQDKRYLVLGRQRQSHYTKHEFELEMHNDFFGVPTESKFCGNTINVNTVSFRQYLDFLGRKYGRSRGQLVGNYQRNVEIDTRTVPQYNDVDLDQWSAKDQTLKREREPSQRDEAQEIECKPESDRISIDELSLLNPNSGKVTINTGPGKDVLSINGVIGKAESNNKNYLVADLGADGNMLSMGAALGIGAKRGSLVAGVLFDNTGGRGRVCYRKEDYKEGEFSLRCVGNVKHVTIFKGSRLHDIVIMGAQGPFTVIQNRGANDYILNMVDIMTNRKPGQPIRFEIMDTSGNLPFIRICQSRHKRVTFETKENDVIKLKASDGEVVVEIRFTGYAPDVDIRSECA